MTAPPFGQREWDAATGELLAGEPIDQDTLDESLTAELDERLRRARELGAEVLEGVERHLPDGTIVRSERALTRAQLRAEGEEWRVACAEAFAEIGAALEQRDAGDVAAAAARVAAAGRRHRERYLALERRRERDAVTTVIRPHAVPDAGTDAPRRASIAAPREHRPARRARARSPGSTGDDPPPPAARLCGCDCGQPVPPGKRGYVDDVHANRARQRRHKARARDAAAADPLHRYRAEIAKACGAGVLTTEDAVELLARGAEDARERLLAYAPRRLRPAILALFAEAA